MKVLLIGDIMGEPGRRAVLRCLPKLIGQLGIDLVVANAENAAGGFGITPDLADELFELGVSVITTGNHAWDKKEILDYFKAEPRLLRPANYPPGVPGSGAVIVETAGGEKVAILHLMGRTFLDIDMARAADLLGLDRRQAEMFRDLKRGSFVALGPALSRRPLPVTIGPVETSGSGGRRFVCPMPSQSCVKEGASAADNALSCAAWTSDFPVAGSMPLRSSGSATN